MKTFIANLLMKVLNSKPAQAVFVWTVERFAMMIYNAILREIERRKVIRLAKESGKKLEDAKTKEEIDAATNSALDDL